jgi:signal transduction histidine kinase
VDRTATGNLRLPVAAFRGLLLLLCLGLSVLPDGVNSAAVARTGVLALAAAVITWMGSRGAAAIPAALLEALMTGALISGSGGSSSPLLPYLLAPGLALGIAGGWRAALLGGGVASVSMVGVRLAASQTDSLQEFALATGQWVLLSVAIGAIAAGARQVGAAPAPSDRYAEAHRLLEQLRAVTHRLPGGLDAPSAATALLDRCQEIRPVPRAAVLARGTGDALVPLAVRGTRRVPWRAPLSAPGPLQRAWTERRAVVDVRRPDKAGRRKGSSLAVLPLLGDDEPFGLVVLESLEASHFDAATLASLAEAVSASALQIETALLFEEVRSTVTLEERDRLARRMHDGMAQDVAFLGYELDALRTRAARTDPELAAGVADVRGKLTGLISDIRMSITDLRTSVDADRGLGGALSSYVRAVGAGKDVTVHLSLQESSFRLPGDQEVLLFQVATAVAQDMRKARRGGTLWVTLITDPPSATLEVEHDGAMTDLAGLGLQEQAEALSSYGGRLDVVRGRSGGPRAVAVLEGDAGDGQSAAGR